MRKRRPPDVVSVPMTLELVTMLEGQWSRPCQLRSVRQPDGTWLLEARDWPPAGAPDVVPHG